MKISTTINGQVRDLEVAPDRTLLSVLRDQLHLTGTKEGCGSGDCGTCTVLMDGVPVTSCLVLAPEADGCQITTIEGIAGDGGLHPVQQALIDTSGFQCGFCTPGFVVSSVALLEANPKPTDVEIKRALAGNLCRCTGYTKIVEAVKLASRKMPRKKK